MQLRQVRIEGFRSIKTEAAMHIEPNVTVIVGANDHGKTNILDALKYLNSEENFDRERDLCWDCYDEPERYPYLQFTLELSEKDRRVLQEEENRIRQTRIDAQAMTDKQLADKQGKLEVANKRVTQLQEDLESAQTSVRQVEIALDQDANSEELKAAHVKAQEAVGKAKAALDSSATTAAQLKAEVELAEKEKVSQDPPSLLRLNDTPEVLVIERRGVEGAIVWDTFPNLDDSNISAMLDKSKPRVELLDPFEGVSDSTTYEELSNAKNEFMKGVFYYAGIELDEWEGVFNQDDVSAKRLEKATDRLNETLKNTWTQGQHLHFGLSHDSQKAAINLRIDDPSVDKRKVRASQRSSGFTHYFSLKTMLYARQREHPAEQYVWLFDEPGIYLHPSGQHDVIHELDAIGRVNQVVYSTHSLFMINKTFPTRHRLIVKDNEGTNVQAKPFTGRWRSVLSALGLHQTGTILFANHVLLAEGDADPILFPAIFQKLVALGKVDMDLNGLSVMATLNTSDTISLIKMLSDSSPCPKMAVLFDGDEGGLNRLKRVKPALEKQGVPWHVLDSGLTSEDLLPLQDELYPAAVGRYLAKLLEDEG